MAIIELNIAGWTFTHGIPDAQVREPRPWQLPRVSVRRPDWQSVLRRKRAA